jgi:hypothetical protein
VDLLHHVAGPVADFLVDAADVLAQEAEGDELAAHEEEEDGEQGEHALGRAFRVQEAVDHQAQEQQEAEAGRDHPEDAEHLQGQEAEAGEQVELEVDELPEPVLALPGRPLGVGHGHLGDALGEAVGERGDEARALLAEQHGVHHVPAVGPQHAAVVMELHAGGLAGDGVDDLAGHGAEEAVVLLAALAPAAHHVEALLHLGHELGDLLGGVLQVGVQGDDDPPLHLGEGPEDGAVLAVVAVELHHPDPGLGLGDVDEHGQAPVPAAVVGEDDLPGLGRIGEVLRHHPGQPLPQRGDVLLLVVDGDDDAQVGVHGRSEGSILVGSTDPRSSPHV